MRERMNPEAFGPSVYHSDDKELIAALDEEIISLKREISKIERRMAKIKIFFIIWAGVMMLFISSVWLSLFSDCSGALSLFIVIIFVYPSSIALFRESKKHEKGQEARRNLLLQLKTRERKLAAMKRSHP